VNVIPVPEPRARRASCSRRRGAVHLPEREPRGTHALAAATSPMPVRSCCGRSSGSARRRCSCSRSGSCSSPTGCCR
jgi:hypothetical protein